MRQKTFLLAFALACSPVAFAGVAELPPVPPLPGTDAMAGAPKVPSAAATASAGTTTKVHHIVP
ncbi:MAG: conjugal transfer protein, partial [Acidithiobacillus caldus]|nr:conjugal transfer protein [Acidithiobacillus caldus]